MHLKGRCCRRPQQVASFASDSSPYARPRAQKTRAPVALTQYQRHQRLKPLWYEWYLIRNHLTVFFQVEAPGLHYTVHKTSIAESYNKQAFKLIPERRKQKAAQSEKTKEEQLAEYTASVQPPFMSKIQHDSFKRLDYIWRTVGQVCNTVKKLTALRRCVQNSVYFI